MCKYLSTIVLVSDFGQISKQGTQLGFHLDALDGQRLSVVRVSGGCRR